MTVVATHSLIPNEPRADSDQIYNCLDSLLTHEIYHELNKLSNEPPLLYQFEQALQAPILEIMLRGIKVDEYEKRKAIAKLNETLSVLDNILQRYAFAVWGKRLNPGSTKQLLDFFYGTMKLQQIWTSKKGKQSLSMDRETLEKLSVHFYAGPIITVILAIRDNLKQLQTLETEIDSDGRYRTSYNIGGTETWRLSSSSNAFGTGGNLQNIAPKLRRVFIADPGWKIGHIDLEQAESREVGWLCGTLFEDWAYLDACESGDLHTFTCKLIWRNFLWTGDNAKDRALAEQIFYREFSYRDMSKRGGHGNNYYGTPYTMARHLKVPQKLMEDFQKSYFQAFPAIPRWHRWVASQLQTIQKLETPFGAVRHFFGRPNDETTLREAIAFVPQSSTATRTNLGLWRIWKHMPNVRLLTQTHDAVDFEFSERENEAEVAEKALKLMEVELTHNGRRFVVPGEYKSGFNLGNFDPKTNPLGLRKFKGSDDRTRPNGLDRIL